MALLTATTARADDAATRYFEQLRRRGLFRLAESVCYRELERKDSTPAQRTQWTLELSRTLAEHAKFSSGKSRTELWDQSVAVIDEFLRREKAPPKLGWLQLQRGIARSLKGEFLRWDAELFPYEPSARKRAQTALAAADKTLSEFVAAVSKPPGQRKDIPNLGNRGLLQRHGRYQLAIVKINLAELAPAKSQQRLDDANAAAKLLRPLAAGAKEQIVTLNSRLLLAMAGRLQGDPKTAGERLTILLKLKPPLNLKFRILAEVVRNHLDAGRHQRANEILTSYGMGGYLPGELAYLKVKTSIALWNAAKRRSDSRNATHWLEQAKKTVKNVEVYEAGYWGYRCRALFDFLKDASTHGPELAGSMRRAAAFYREKKIDAAIREYLSAARIAANAKQPATAVEMTYAGASLELQSERFEDAAKSFATIPKNWPNDAKAAQADLMAVYCLGRHYDARRTKARRLAYTQALLSHRRKFAKSATSHEAAWMLAGLHDYRNQTSEALPLYLSIPAGHTRSLAARVEAARCFDEIIQRIRELKRPAERAKWEASAASHLGGFLEEFPRSPAVWNRQHCDVALRTARIELNRARPRYRLADRWLSRILTAAASYQKRSNLKKDDRDWWTAVENSARQQQIVALAGNGRIDDATNVLTALSNTGPGEVLAVLDGLMQVNKSSNARLQQRLGGLLLQAAQRLDAQRDRLKPAEQKWLDRCLAQAYSATGNVGNAVEKYEKLLAKSPRNKQHLRSAAALLARSSERKILIKSRGYWRRLQALERAGSTAWFEARVADAQVSFQLSDFDECLKTIRKTKLVYPNLGGSNTKSRFEKLEAAVKAKRQ